MPLDLSKTIVQIDSMASRLATASESKRHKLEIALDTMAKHSQDLSAIRHRVAKAMAARTSTWLAAGILDGINVCNRPPAVPAEFTVIAADGSHIDVDRHYSTHCFLINIGLVKLSYGQHPEASLSSSPSLYYDENDVVLAPPSANEQPEPIQGPLLGVKRSVDECGALVSAAKELQGTAPAICLVDGSLILWGLTGTTYPRFVIDTLIGNGLIKHFSEIERLGSERAIGLASYISFPRNTEVVNTLRLALCPFDDVDCDRNCPNGTQKKPCDVIGGLLDRDIFQQLLREGERSAIFASLSSIVTSHYGQHQICFFYLNTGNEIARVEVPFWTASNANVLSTTHAILFDQCRRGGGYPVAISEAHEQAVITSRDREEFWRLVEDSLARRNITMDTSLKSQSKRTRWL